MHDVCMNVVRQGDKDMFLCLLFAPEAVQLPLFALHAFAVEVSRIPHLVSEPQIGEIRLQWWADVVEAIGADSVQDHPVAHALAEAVKGHNLPLAPLRALVEAHRFDLYADRFATLNDLEGYCGEVRSSLFQLSTMLLDRSTAPVATEASGFAGVAFELARVMALRGHERFVPRDKTRADVIALAGQRFEEARGALASLPLMLMPIFLPLALVPGDLDAARRGTPRAARWKRQWRIWRAARSGLL